ncbi:MAG: DNA-directed RNA polymerase subunit alpha, partial [Phycisphaerales bacterium]|nr:DNA-directed RNA polymerase subunit alpha [Phycisphaerales bacterium]
EDALIESAKILRKHVNALLHQIDPGIEIDVPVIEEDNSEPAKFSKDLAGLLQLPLATLELSVRSSNCLESAKIHTVGDLVKLTESELLKVRSFGKTSLREIKRRLAEKNLSLGMTIPEEEAAPVGDAEKQEEPAEKA